jgi:Asp-tRNA(Asn)/Glu-tRNA(Gln) amidotransferase A subunit family amidase
MLDYRLVESVHSGELALPEYLTQVESWFLEREPSVLAFVPEENRFEHLQKEAEALVSRFPDPGNRPPLFGMLVGVKDNIHVEGFHAAGTQSHPRRSGREAESIAKLKMLALILEKRSRLNLLSPVTQPI